MSEILSYSNNTSKNGEEDWIGHAPYSDDDIARIKDPDGGLSENPRTAIPSPLAQLDLVKNAFKQLANERLRGARMNERLVSNALDVAQLFFDYENHKDYLRIIRWNREECLEQLKSNLNTASTARRWTCFCAATRSITLTCSRTGIS